MFANAYSFILKVIAVIIVVTMLAGTGITIIPEGPDGEGDYESAEHVPEEDQAPRRSRGAWIVPDEMVEYLIVSPEAFVDEYKPLAEWKTRKGVPAKIVTVESITSNPVYWNATNSTFNDTATMIQQFLSDFNVDNDYNLIWVLLGADSEWIPARTIYTEGSKYLQYGEDYYPSDCFYAGLSHDWDNNDDGIYGEINATNASNPIFEVDYNPKAFVGRLPADNSVHVKNYVDSLIDYEQSPILDGWLNSALLTDAVFDPPNVFDNYSTTKTDEGYGAWEDNGLEATNKVMPYFQDNFNITHLYDYNQIEGGNYSSDTDILDQDSFTDAVNEGYGIVNVVSHSFLSGNGTVSYGGEGIAESWKRFFYYTDAASMINGAKRSFMYFSDCDVLNFTETDDSNFEQLFTNPNGGAVAVVGPTGSTYRGESIDTLSLGNWWIADHFWDLFEKGTIRPGENLYKTKWDYYNYWIDDLQYTYDWPSMRVNMASYNLLGDPEVPIWPGEPKELKAVVPNVYINSKDIWINVTNATGVALPGALVCIQGDDGTYLRFTTDSNGTVNIASTFNQVATFNLTITKDGYLPHVGELRIRPEPPDLTINSEDDITFNFPDDPPLANSLGNISVWVTNIGKSATESGYSVNFTDIYTYMGQKFTDYLGVIETGVIAKDGKVQVSIKWTPLKPGEHNIKITVDPADVVDEADEANNMLTKVSSISGPDLKIIAANIVISPAAAASVGDRININATIINSDFGSAGTFTVSFYDGNPDADGTLLTNATFTGTLAYNEKTSLNISAPPLDYGGTHNYYAVADSQNNIVESNEVNNRAFIDYYVNYPPEIIDVKDLIIPEDETDGVDIDLLGVITINDEDNNDTDMVFSVISVSEPDCGFSLRDGRYVDLSPTPEWHGISIINLSLTDGVAFIFTELRVVVESVNDPPKIESIILNSDIVKPKDTIELSLVVSDIDNEILKISVSSETNLFMTRTYTLDVQFGTPLSVDALTWDGAGNITFSYNPINSEPKVHRIKVSVSDDRGTVSETVTLELESSDETDDGDLILGMEAGKAYMVLALIIILVIVIAVLFGYASAKRKERAKEEAEEEEES